MLDRAGQPARTNISCGVAQQILVIEAASAATNPGPDGTPRSGGVVCWTRAKSRKRLEHFGTRIRAGLPARAWEPAQPAHCWLINGRSNPPIAATLVTIDRGVREVLRVRGSCAVSETIGRSLALAECCPDLVRRQWFREVPALRGVAAEGAQPGGLGGGFDLLCGDGETERVGEIDHCSGDLLVG